MMSTVLARSPRRILCALSTVLFCCSRPVDRPATGDTFITELVVNPEFVREGVPVDISFRVFGAPPKAVRYDISGQRFDCSPEDVGEGRMRCVHQSLDRVGFKGPLYRSHQAVSSYNVTAQF